MHSIEKLSFFSFKALKSAFTSKLVNSLLCTFKSLAYFCIKSLTATWIGVHKSTFINSCEKNYSSEIDHLKCL